MTEKNVIKFSFFSWQYFLLETIKACSLWTGRCFRHFSFKWLRVTFQPLPQGSLQSVQRGTLRLRHVNQVKCPSQTFHDREEQEQQEAVIFYGSWWQRALCFSLPDISSMISIWWCRISCMRTTNEPKQLPTWTHLKRQVTRQAFVWKDKIHRYWRLSSPRGPVQCCLSLEIDVWPLAQCVTFSMTLGEILSMAYSC